jgi:hypothetical protein
MKDVIDRIRSKFPLLSVMVTFNDLINDSCKQAYGENNAVSLASFKEVLRTEIRNAAISYTNSNHQIEQLPRYLVACVRSTADKLSNNDKTKSNVHVCPGCRSLDRYSILEQRAKNFVCRSCEDDSLKEEDPVRKSFFTAFSLQEKKGLRCPDCSRFIPNQNDGDYVSCPYMDCGFSGEREELEEMRRPVGKGTLEVAILDAPIKSGHDSGGSSVSMKDTGFRGTNGGSATISGASTSSDLAVQQTIQANYETLMGVIDSQMSSLHYHSNQSTLLHKKNMYEAFKIIIAKYPEEMISYLVYTTRGAGIQHKIFQEYVQLMEASLPFSFVKNGKSFTITSLLDPELCIFDGVSEYSTIVTSKHEAINETKERYVGGRKGFYDKPFYIGKLLDVFDSATGDSLMANVTEYSFFRINFDKTVKPGTVIDISHCRIPPHYQMGSLVHLNRIRRKIVDTVYVKMHGVKRKPSR